MIEKIKTANQIGSFILLVLISLAGCSENKDQGNSNIAPSPPPQVDEVEEDTVPNVKIGEQIWMTENLNLTHFKDGSVIKESKTTEEWNHCCANGIPTWCYYENDSLYSEKFGKLYNCFAVNDSRKIAPEGWHLPSNEEWDQMNEFLGREKSGIKLKANIDSENIDSSANISGFTAYLSGYRDTQVPEDSFMGKSEEGFYDLSFGGYWWSSAYGCYWGVNSISPYFDKMCLKHISPEYYGFSIRCLKD